MANFFEKLKKGMGIEELKENSKEEEEVKDELRQEKNKEREETETKEKKEREEKSLKEKKVKVTTSFSLQKLNEEGEPLIDLYQTEEELILQSPLAGVDISNLEITIEEDVLTIKGERKNPAPQNADYFLKECYWGPFFREIILPTEVDGGRAEAKMEEGVLIIRLPKILREKRKIIKVKN